MKLKHKLTSVIIGVAVLMSPVFGAVVPFLGSGTASAATVGTLAYALLSPDGGGQQTLGVTCYISPLDPSASCPDQDTISGGGLKYLYKAGTSYTFVLDTANVSGFACQSTNPATITVSKSTPGKGTYKSCAYNNGQATTVAIGSTSVFTNWVNSGGATSAGNVAGDVTGKLKVDFGTIDSTKLTTADDVIAQIQCAPDDKPGSAACKLLVGPNSVNGADGSGIQAAPDVGSVTKNPVVYSQTFQGSGLKAGQKYIVCFSGKILSKTVCTNDITAKKLTPVSGAVSASGNIQALSTSSSNGDNKDLSCESSAGALGWILCQMIDGLQAAVGGIYDNVIKPLLVTKPITTSDKVGNQIYKAWSNFRVYGDIFLVIAIIVIVFGESIGGGLIDAYTAKKVLPRLLVAAILINISYYVVAILVDITNIVGNGLMELITAPFGLTGDFTLDINKTGAATMTALLAGAFVWAKVSLAGQFVPWLIFSVLLPFLLLTLSILAVVLIRRALIVFLVIISPVAFALYCLPNTEKYFRKWWDILFETLLVYPIIAALFALGKVGAYLINQSGGTNFIFDGLAGILSVVALAVPLLLVPFSFKLAGGFVGRAYDLASGARTKMALGQASRERIKEQGRLNRVQARAKYHSKLQEQASKGDPRTFRGALRRSTLGLGAKGMGGMLGYNVEAEASAARAQVGKTLNDQIATGRDEEIRGLTVNKAHALRNGVEGEDWRMEGGRRQFRSLGGQWIDEADVDKGHARWGKDTFAQQTALSYEMRKAQTEGQLQHLARNYSSVAQGPGGWGMNDQEAQGAWIGAAFERQNEHLEFKSTDWKSGELKAADNGLRGGGLVDEIYEKKGSYSVAQMGSNTIEQLKVAHQSANDVITQSDTTLANANATQAERDAAATARRAAVEQQEKIAAISETFMHEYGASGGLPDDRQAEAQATTSPGAPSRRQANTPGAAHVAERVKELAIMAGTYDAAPTGLYSDPAHAPTPNQRSQN